MLVALPSAVAFGLLVYSSVGFEYTGLAALSGIVGTMSLALVAPLLGGSQRLVTAPCAPAAAVSLYCRLWILKWGRVINF